MAKYNLVLSIMAIILLTTIQISESSECLDIVCPAIGELICPNDSDVITIDPKTFNNNNNNNNNIDNFDNNNNEHYPSEGGSNIYIEKNSDEQIITKQSKRSVQYTKRESIQITPGEFRNKRSMPDDEYKKMDENNLHNELINKCCVQEKCICKKNCKIPTCLDNEYKPIAHDNNTELGKPGNCCPNYECQLQPNCHNVENYKWIEPCQTCHCLENEKICHLTCEIESPQLSKLNCKSDNNNLIILDGDHWMEDPCTSCICDNGFNQCQISVCQPLLCENKIQLPGSCCPICNYNQTIFCNGHENCDIACKIGYIKTDNDCHICKCVKSTDTTIYIDNNNNNINNNNNNNLNNSNNIINTENNDSIRILNEENYQLKTTIHQLTNENYTYFFVIIVLSLVVTLFLCLIIYLLCNRRNHGSYKTVPTSVDSNLNNIPKSI